MVTAARPSRVEELTAAQGRALVEERVRRALGIGLDEFVWRWQSGAYGEFDDHPEILELAMLLPVVGVNPWRNGTRT